MADSAPSCACSCSASARAAAAATTASAAAVAVTVASSDVAVELSRSFHRRDLPAECVPFSSPMGKRLFREAMNAEPCYMESYFPLAEQFITQAEPAYCGLATLAMCLNALAIDPGRLWKGPWRWFSEELFDCCTPLSVAKTRGISLSEFVCLAKCNGATIQERRATGELTLDAFRDIVRQSCAGSGEIVVLNYSRKVLGQTGDGHFSPIGGYHPVKDMVLLLDVARFKYPPHWIDLRLAFESMQRPDPSNGQPRGLAVLRENKDLEGGAALPVNRLPQERVVAMASCGGGGGDPAEPTIVRACCASVNKLSTTTRPSS